MDLTRAWRNDCIGDQGALALDPKHALPRSVKLLFGHTGIDRGSRNLIRKTGDFELKC